MILCFGAWEELTRAVWMERMKVMRVRRLRFAIVALGLTLQY